MPPIPAPPAKAAPAQTFGAAASDTWTADVNNPIRRVGLNLALVLLFLRLTGLHEVAAAKFGVNTYALYILGLPAIACMLLSGGLARTVRAREAKYWVGFAACMIFAIPFSDWIRGSLDLVMKYLRIDFVVLFLIAGLAMTWRECWRLLNVLILSAFSAVLIGHLFQNEAEGRTDRLELSDNLTMSNSDDYAALVALLLPFLILFIITPGRNIVLRLMAIGTFAYGLFLVLTTASRGAEVAILIAAVYALSQLKPIQRIWVTLAVIVVGILVVAALPAQVTQRLATLAWSQEDAYTSEAAGSAESRVYLLKKSLLYTIQRPLTGVGPGEFSDHEGFAAKALGHRGSWHETHNTYTQVSSENGILAAFFFIAALLGTYRLLRRTLKQVRSRPPTPENRQFTVALYCVSIAVVGFCSNVFFLSLAYRFYLPALTGIAIALSRAVQRELSQSQPSLRKHAWN